ncbi:hypothetical protein P20652_2799 [Pseudoalteromonas sp. BSi20652]|nr:hypothetical protein P20652_2799 [Pseudoalteromonas sp. BSi20652]
MFDIYSLRKRYDMLVSLTNKAQVKKLNASSLQIRFTV